MRGVLASDCDDRGRQHYLFCFMWFNTNGGRLYRATSRYWFACGNDLFIFHVRSPFLRSYVFCWMLFSSLAYWKPSLLWLLRCLTPKYLMSRPTIILFSYGLFDIDCIILSCKRYLFRGILEINTRVIKEAVYVTNWISHSYVTFIHNNNASFKVQMEAAIN